MADELILERFGLRHTNTWGTHHVIWLTNECIFFKIARGGKSTLIRVALPITHYSLLPRAHLDPPVIPPQHGRRGLGTDRKNPAKIGARNSSFASFDLGVGGRLRGPPSQPDAQARSRGRNARLTPADSRGVSHVRGVGGLRTSPKTGRALVQYGMIHHDTMT